MQNTYKIILRNLEIFHSNLLIINQDKNDLLDLLPKAKSFVVNYDVYDYLQVKQERIVFDTNLPNLAEFEEVLMFVFKAKEFNFYLLEKLQNKTIYMVGENSSSVESIARKMQNFCEVVKIDNAKHCKLYKLTFIKIFQADKQKDAYDLNFHNISLKIATLPQVFSYHKLDLGSQTLLPFLENLQETKILDFGCGSGVLGAYILKANVNRKISLTSVDVDLFACQTTHKTMQINALQSDIKALNSLKLLQQKFDLIISNPPFHSGYKTDYTITENLIRDSKIHLSKNGRLLIVANDFLPYQQIIFETFNNCEILCKQNGFCVYQAINN